MSYSQRFVLSSRCSAHFNLDPIHRNLIRQSRWTATIHPRKAKTVRAVENDRRLMVAALGSVATSTEFCTRVCDGTATILTIFVGQSSRAGHQLTAAHDG